MLTELTFEKLSGLLGIWGVVGYLVYRHVIPDIKHRKESSELNSAVFGNAQVTIERLESTVNLLTQQNKELFEKCHKLELEVLRLEMRSKNDN